MIERRAATLSGIVQGIGFRPFVARLADRHQLTGFVRNRGGQVALEVEGPVAALDRFSHSLTTQAPPGARIDRLRWQSRPPVGEPGFRIEDSDANAGIHGPGAPPDLAPCSACIRELADPEDPRYRYPFTTCTACGPRFTIVEALPYDRARTTMKRFVLCGLCRSQYCAPGDRRYHAQPIACPACGPQLHFRTHDDHIRARGDEGLQQAIGLLRHGGILALQGVGGFQLLVDASNAEAVERLRQRKRRPAKPLAVMVRDLTMARQLVGPMKASERAALSAPSAPIVLLAKGSTEGCGSALCAAIAPGSPYLGLMLPSSPLHHLLMHDLGTPVVATSGNVHDEPMAIDPDEAWRRLGPAGAGIADGFLWHDRAIVRRCDDSVIQILGQDHLQTLRLGRGLGPLSWPAPSGLEGTAVVAYGSHLHNAPAALMRGRLLAWPHVGDLDTLDARTALTHAVADMCRFSEIEPVALACDRHPDQGASIAARRAARDQGLSLMTVGHHHAHVAACLAEHGVDSALGVAWDGMGLADTEDGDELWGGEWLRVTPAGAERVAHMWPFPLPGGDAAARDGRRALAGVLVAAGVSTASMPDIPDLDRFVALAHRRALCSMTSSVGRLFDAVAALTGVCPLSRYQAEAAMQLEALAVLSRATPYPISFGRGRAGRDGRCLVVDWRPMMTELIGDRGDPIRAASRFHATLVHAVVTVVEHLQRQRAAPAIALVGGCFQNRVLVAGCRQTLTERGLTVLLPGRIPPNDGGLAVGQAWVAGHRLVRHSQVRGG